MTLGPLYDDLIEPSLIPGQLGNGAGPIAWPGTEQVHAALVRTTIENNQDLCLLSPTLKHEHLDLLSLQAAFALKGSARPSVFVLSSDTSVRERFREFRPVGHTPYSRRDTPVANLSNDGSLTMKTEHYRKADAFPRFIFRRTSTRLPPAEVTENLGCVIYDETVKFTDDRWERFQAWRDQHEIPSVVYCVRDPVGDLCESLEDDIVRWGWSPRLIRVVLDAHEKTASFGVITKDEPMSTPETEHVERLLANKVSGLEYDLHVCNGEVGDMLSGCWNEVTELESLASNYDSDVLLQAVSRVKSTVGLLSQSVASIETLDNYYINDYSHHSILAHVKGLDSFNKQVTNDEQAAPASGVYRTAAKTVTDAYEDWGDLPLDAKKRSAVLKVLRDAQRTDEDVIILVRDEPSVHGLKADLELNRPEFYREVRDSVEFYSPSGLPLSEPVDRMVVYGPLRYQDRWVLRTPHAGMVTVLAYPHELGLLQSQIRRLNARLSEFTDKGWQREVIDSLGGGDEDLPAVDSIDIDVPDDPTEAENEVTSAYELVSVTGSDGVDDIIDRHERRFDWESMSEARVASPSSSSDGGSVSGITVDDCYELRFSDGKSMYFAPTDSVDVVVEDGEAMKVAVSKASPGDIVITINSPDSLRSQLKDILVERGDIELIFHAEMWKNDLERVIENEGDSLDEFIDRLEEAGIDRTRATFRNWYNGDVSYTRYKEDMRKIAEAYGLDDVKENFEVVWDAIQTTKNITRDLHAALRKQAVAAIDDDPEEVVISKEYDIRLSDFAGEGGEELVQRREVADIVSDVTIERRRLRRIIESDEATASA